MNFHVGEFESTSTMVVTMARKMGRCGLDSERSGGRGEWVSWAKKWELACQVVTQRMMSVRSQKPETPAGIERDGVLIGEVSNMAARWRIAARVVGCRSRRMLLVGAWCEDPMS